MRKRFFCLPVLLIVSCGTPCFEGVIAPQGTVIECDDMRLEIPAGGVAESTEIKIEKKSTSTKSYEQGFSSHGISYVIQPEALVFEKPVFFSVAAENQDVVLAARIGTGFVPCASSKTENRRLKAELWHGGEYSLLKKPHVYGILEHSKTKEALLIVSDVYVGDYIENLIKTLRRGGYELPIWIFVYPGNRGIEENAFFLADELKKLHELYGDFRLDIVSFGIGGLITHRYANDSTLYNRDISSAVIAVGTPFYGSSFADLNNAKKARSPYRFFFIDAMGERASELLPESEFIGWVRSHRRLTQGYYDDLAENKNFASLGGTMGYEGEFPEESEGDGLVSLSSTMLTAIEPEPFLVDHFGLYKDNSVLAAISSFVQLYRTFNWPLTFLNVWREKEQLSTACEIWEKEARLIYRAQHNIDVLLEFNENMLKSAPKDAILITNGDNDTYPAWYLQNKGVRNDVLVVNRNLLNIKENILFLQKHGLPLDLTAAELEEMKPKKKDEEILTISDQLIAELLKERKRQVVFSTTVYEPERFGYPLTLSGLVYEIGEGEVDKERTHELLHNVLSFEKLKSVPAESLSIHIRNLAKNYATSAFCLSLALGLTTGNAEALRELEFAMQFSDDPLFYYNKALAYLHLDKRQTADSIFRIILNMPTTDVETKKEIAKAYYDAGMKSEAIKVLADCLGEMPENKELSELIKRYQEGL